MDGGFDVDLASEFRSWEGEGDCRDQQQIRDEAGAVAHRLVSTYLGDADPPSLWFTYHLYHKAPDWIGPVVCSSLGIPYVIAEASYAPRQHGGPWHDGHEQCRSAIHSADAVVSLNRRDDPCLRELLKPSCELLELEPFISLDGFSADAADRMTIARKWGAPGDKPWLVSVAMMRCGDKLASYRELAQALAPLAQEGWHLFVVGDGPARPQVHELLEPIAPHATFTGLLARDEILDLLRSADLYVWPAVNEAYGMALLEAQACGLPVVASAFGGVPQIVRHESTGLLAPPNEPLILSRYIRRLIREPSLRRRMGAYARDACAREHDIRLATAALAGLFGRLTTTGTHRRS